ncbi:MAG: DNA polymerase III subunit delta [Acidobacteria bacterium]|nr:DNA polymerase III subunit delta [Acidobacteriota bacterium]
MAGKAIVLLIGSEVFLRRERLEQLVREALPDGFSDFNYMRMDAREKKLVDILSSWEERGFGGGNRVIHVENIGKLRMKGQEKVAELFLDRVKKGGVPRAVLILEGESVDRRTSFFKKLAAAVKTEEFKPIKSYQVPAFIGRRLKQKGYEITPDAAEFLADFASSELMAIASELEKLILFVGDETREITLEHVRGLLMPSRSYSTFDLQDAILARHRDTAHRALQSMLTEGVSPIVIWRFFQSTFGKARRLEQARSREEMNRISRSAYYLDKLRQLGGSFPGGAGRALVLTNKLELASRRGNLADSFYLGYLLDGLFRMMR